MQRGLSYKHLSVRLSVRLFVKTKFSHRRSSWMFQISDILLRFEELVKVSKIEAKFRTFRLPVKFRGWVGKRLSEFCEFSLRPNLSGRLSPTFDEVSLSHLHRSLGVKNKA